MKEEFQQFSTISPDIIVYSNLFRGNVSSLEIENILPDYLPGKVLWLKVTRECLTALEECRIFCVFWRKCNSFFFPLCTSTLSICSRNLDTNGIHYIIHQFTLSTSPLHSLTFVTNQLQPRYLRNFLRGSLQNIPFRLSNQPVDYNMSKIICPQVLRHARNAFLRNTPNLFSHFLGGLDLEGRCRNFDHLD